MNELMKGRKKIVTGLAAFLGFMLVCTLVSKGIYASTLPQVTLQEPKKMAIRHEVSVPGNVKQSRELAVNVPAGLRVEEVAVMPGDKVGAGDTLFTLDKEYLEEQKQDMELEIRRLDLQISAVQNNLGLAAQEKDREMIRAGEDAVRDIQSSDKNLNRAQEDEAAARAELAEHEANPVDVTSDSRRAEKKKAYEEWKKQYSDAVKRVNDLQTEISLLDKRIAALNGETETAESKVSVPETTEGPETGSGPVPTQSEEPTGEPASTESEEQTGEQQPSSGEEAASTENVQEGEEQKRPESSVAEETASVSEGGGTVETASVSEGGGTVETAAVPESDGPVETINDTENAYFSKDDINTLTREKEQREEELIRAQARVAELAANPVENPDFSAEDAQLEAWRAEQKGLQDKLKAAQRVTEDQNDAKDNTLTDAGRKLEDSLSPENVDSTLELYKLERSKAKKNLEEIGGLLEEEGRIAAERSGIITRVNVSPGDLAAAGAAVVFADINEALRFEVFLDKEQKKYVNQGDEAELQLGTQMGGTIKVTVDYLTESEISPGSYSAVMKLPEDTGTIGQSGMFSITAQTDTYDCCIPMEAMHEEFGDKYYVFVLEEKSSILGKELFVQKVSVNVLDKNDRYAAITPGVINQESQIIYSSTKELEDGQVVRMKD